MLLCHMMLIYHLFSGGKKLDNTAEVSVRFPHDNHGLAGNTSNNAKLSVKEQFLNFVDLNSQPNGRSADSSSATHYFLPKCRTVQTPKIGVRNYEQRYSQSVVGEFNRSQTENGHSTISNFSVS